MTDAVLEEVSEWQNRPLEPMYAIVFCDALRVKIRDEGTVRNKAIYLAVGVRADGRKEVLGLWIETTEGAKFWLRVMTEIKNRGTNDILIAVVDGLKGFPEAITAVFPDATVQTCVVHLIRNSLAFASWKERKPVATALRFVYRAENADIAKQRLEEFDASVWGRKYPAIAQAWRRHWEQVIPFLASRSWFGKSFTRPTLLKAYTAPCVAVSDPGGTSRATRRPASSFGWSCAM